MLTVENSNKSKDHDKKNNQNINNIQKSIDNIQNKNEDVASSVERSKKKKETIIEMVSPLGKGKLSSDKNKNYKRNKTRKFLIFILIGLLLLLTTISVLFYITKNKQNKSENEYQKEQELIKEAFNPSFIMNSKTGCFIAKDNVGCTSCNSGYYLMNHQCIQY